MSYDFFSMNTICDSVVLHHRLFYCVNELFRVPDNNRKPQLSRPSNAEFLCAVVDYLNR